MSAKRFLSWVTYFREMEKNRNVDTDAHKKIPGINQPEFRTDSIVYFSHMAFDLKRGVEKTKFVHELNDAHTPKDKMRVILADQTIMNFFKTLTDDMMATAAAKPLKRREEAGLHFKKGSRDFSAGAYSNSIKNLNSAMLLLPPDAEGEVSYRKIYRLRSLAFLRMKKIKQANTDLQMFLCDERNTLQEVKEYFEEVAEVCEDMALMDECKVAKKTLSDLDEGRLHLRQMQVRQPRKDPTDDFTPDNDLLEGASSAVQLGVDPIMGRRLVASQDLFQGEAVMTENPILQRMAWTSVEDFCYLCMAKLNDRFDPCFTCHEVRYCSPECREACWDEHHKAECGYVSIWQHLMGGSDAIRCLGQFGIKRMLQESKRTLSMDYFKKNRLYPSYPHFASLFAHYKHMDPQQIFVFLCEALVALFVGEHLGFLDGKHRNAEVAGLLAETVLRSKVNTWAIYSEVNHRIAAGIFIVQSMYNHSCDPNISLRYFGRRMVTFAIKNIKKGEELFLSYGPTVQLMDVMRRQNCLKKSYDFYCGCDACEKELDAFCGQITYEKPPSSHEEDEKGSLFVDYPTGCGSEPSDPVSMLSGDMDKMAT